MPVDSRQRMDEYGGVEAKKNIKFCVLSLPKAQVFNLSQL